MKKINKTIIISTITLLLITITLLGLTYAYYRTRVTGNENPTTIQAVGRKLQVVYSDDSNVVTAIDAEPGKSYSKTFSVTNDSNKTENYSIILDNLTSTFSRTGGEKDWQYVLTKIKTDGTEEPVTSGYLPMNVQSAKIYVMHSISVESNVKDTYKLTLNYINYENQNQSDDMGKTLNLRVNISDPTSSLFANAGDNTLLKLIGDYNDVTVPSTIPGQQNNLALEAVLAIGKDSYGESLYFRGSVENNYVDFAGMCWRIVRIDGNGNIKLILEDQDNSCQFNNGNWNITDTSGSTIGRYGFTVANKNAAGTVLYLNDYLHPHRNYTAGKDYPSFMVTAFYNFQNTSLANYTDKLVNDWCIDNTTYGDSNGNNLLDSDTISSYLNNDVNFYYGAHSRLVNEAGNPTLECKGTKITEFEDVSKGTTTYITKSNMYVATLTADEVAFAGAKYAVKNNSFYLLNNYQIVNDLQWLTLTPNLYTPHKDSIFYTDDLGRLLGKSINSSTTSYRPAIILKSDVIASVLDPSTNGEAGTTKNPYVIN